jgi:hypothetical protein
MGPFAGGPISSSPAQNVRDLDGRPCAAPCHRDTARCQPLAMPRSASLARNIEAAQDSERHGVSPFGDLKYPAESISNPNAPKGGVFSHVGAKRSSLVRLRSHRPLTRARQRDQTRHSSKRRTAVGLTASDPSPCGARARSAPPGLNGVGDGEDTPQRRAQCFALALQ